MILPFPGRTLGFVNQGSLASSQEKTTQEARISVCGPAFHCSTILCYPFLRSPAIAKFSPFLETMIVEERTSSGAMRVGKSVARVFSWPKEFGVLTRRRYGLNALWCEPLVEQRYCHLNGKAKF